MEAGGDAPVGGDEAAFALDEDDRVTVDAVDVVVVDGHQARERVDELAREGRPLAVLELDDGLAADGTAGAVLEQRELEGGDAATPPVAEVGAERGPRRAVRRVHDGGVAGPAVVVEACWMWVSPAKSSAWSTPSCMSRTGAQPVAVTSKRKDRSGAEAPRAPCARGQLAEPVERRRPAVRGHREVQVQAGEPDPRARLVAPRDTRHAELVPREIRDDLRPPRAQVGAEAGPAWR